MEVKPVIKPVVKPVAVGVKPVVTTVNVIATPVTETATEPTKVTSVTELTKEERLKDVKGAVAKVETKNSTKKKDTKPKVNKNSNKKKEVTEGEVVRKEPVKKVIEGIEIDYTKYQEQEEEMKKRIFEYDGNVVFMDITTTEMSTLQELWQAGKAPYDRKLGEYILSYDALSDTLSKVYLDEIISVTTENYYDDVRALNPTLLGHYHTVYHRGRRIYDRINDRTFDYIMGNCSIKEINVVTVDVHTRCRFFGVDISKITDDLYSKTITQKVRDSSQISSINLDAEGGE